MTRVFHNRIRLRIVSSKEHRIRKINITHSSYFITYCDGLLKVISPDGRIHSSFNQTETRTGRISSTEPNLQNIPVRTELGVEMRKFFIAKEGYTLVDADYLMKTGQGGNELLEHIIIGLCA